jgi:hypothetical protein
MARFNDTLHNWVTETEKPRNPQKRQSVVRYSKHSVVTNTPRCLASLHKPSKLARLADAEWHASQNSCATWTRLHCVNAHSHVVVILKLRSSQG